MGQTKEQSAIHVSILSIIANILLSAFKLFAGVFAHSTAMISDAIHSLSDVFSTIIVIIGIRMSHRQSDKEHPYGHERMECVAAILLAVTLAATGLGIGYTGVLGVIGRRESVVQTPGVLALIAAIVSISVKEAMYWYARAAAKRLSSSALMADAWHHRSDALSSVGSLFGILGARMGFPFLDPLAGVVIAFFVLKAAVSIFLESVGRMTDRASDDATIRRIFEIVSEQESVLGVDQIKTRVFGDKIYVDVEISANGESTLRETHAVAEHVHDAIEEQMPMVKHCMVHVNPWSVQSSE